MGARVGVGMRAINDRPYGYDVSAADYTWISLRSACGRLIAAPTRGKRNWLLPKQKPVSETKGNYFRDSGAATAREERANYG